MTEIERVPVTSSVVISVGFHEIEHILEVEWKSTRKDGLPTVKRYHPVQGAFFQRLLEPGTSVGGAIHALIRSRNVTISKIS